MLNLLPSQNTELPEERKLTLDSEINNVKQAGLLWPSNWVKNTGDPGKEMSV